MLKYAVLVLGNEGILYFNLQEWRLITMKMEGKRKIN
jgi:hypothetical protein